MTKFKYFFAILLLSFSLFGADEGENGYVILPEQTVHKGDYFAAGGTIEISGLVEGDVYAFGSRVIVDGKVLGDVIASGGTIEIDGEVGGNARLAGGQIDINGTIGRNVTAMGGNIEFSPSAVVKGNVVLTGGIIDLSGKVRGNVLMTTSNARIFGSIEGNIEAYVGHLRVGSRADIGGQLVYSSSEDALIDSGAQIKGGIIYHPSLMKEFFKGKWKQGLIIGSRLAGILMSFFYCLVLGWIVIKVFPRKLENTLRALKKRPGKALWVGLVTILLLPVVSVALFITVLGFPIGLALLAFGLLGFYAAKIFPILWISRAIFKRMSLWIFITGLIGFFLIAQIPFFGSLISFIFTALGVGAVIIGRMPKKQTANN